MDPSVITFIGIALDVALAIFYFHQVLNFDVEDTEEGQGDNGWVRRRLENIRSQPEGEDPDYQF